MALTTEVLHLVQACQPTSKEARRWLLMARRRIGTHGLALVGLTPAKTAKWLSGENMSQLAKRQAFQVYAMTCRPDILATFFDLATFGRFKSRDCDATALAEHLLDRRTGPKRAGRVKPPGPPWKRNAALKRAYLMPGSGLPITL